MLADKQLIETIDQLLNDHPSAIETLIALEKHRAGNLPALSRAIRAAMREIME